MNINNMKIAVIDIETTGFLNNGGQIIEVGIAQLNTANGQVTTIFNHVCHESIPIDSDAWIFKNSNLTIEEVEDSETLELMRLGIQDAIDSCDAATAYNKKFDFGFLRSRGFKIESEVTCPMLAATPICKIPNARGGDKWPKVQEAWNFFFPNSDYIEEHRGADDAYHEALILMELIKLGAIHHEGENPYKKIADGLKLTKYKSTSGDGSGEELPEINNYEWPQGSQVTEIKNDESTDLIDDPIVKFKINRVEQLAIQSVQKEIHLANVAAGWWSDFKDYENSGNLATLAASKLALIHSEISEALEGVRKDLNDDHLTGRKAFEVELADAAIRIFDLAEAFGLDIAGAMAEKFQYNQMRDDHKIENRNTEGGKKI